MREILFRGFTPDERGKTEIFVNGKPIKGQWVQGNYWQFDITTYCFKEDYEAHPDNTKHYILFDEMTDWGLPNRRLQADVIPETVGQYTGLCDKNGKKIFEGDICQIKGISYIDETPFVIEWNNDWGSWYWRNLDFGSATDSFTHSIAKMSKVIGNIHDNPELLNYESR